MESGLNPWLYIAEQRKRDRLKQYAKSIYDYCHKLKYCDDCIFFRHDEENPEGYARCWCEVDDSPKWWEAEEWKR